MHPRSREQDAPLAAVPMSTAPRSPVTSLPAIGEPQRQSRRGLTLTLRRLLGRTGLRSAPSLRQSDGV